MNIQKIQISGDEWQRYKQDAPVPEGTYYRVGINRPSTKQKKALGLIAATGPGVNFCWLAPAEPWVQQILAGGRVLFDPNTCLVEPDWKVLGISPTLLRPWQKQAVMEAWTTLAHDQPYRHGWIVSLGGGKTLAGLLICQMFDRAAVLAERYLHSTWREQAKQWGLTCPIISTAESCHKLPDDIECLIIDECLKIKTPDARRSIQVRLRSEKVEACVAFTATATAGRGPLDFRWLCSVVPGCMPSADITFQFMFADEIDLVEVAPGRSTYQVTSWDDDKLTEWMKPYITTIDTSELIAHLPEIEFRYVDCPTPTQYAVISSGGASEKGIMKALAQSRQCTDGFIYDDNDHPIRLNERKSKIDMVKEYVENLGEPVLIYSAWREGVNMLKEKFHDQPVSVVEGGTADPSAEVERFRSGETQVMIANSRFARGMNLQEACRIILFLSLSSLPDDYEQALGRVYRPGQTKGCVVVFFCCENTLDRRIIELVQRHRTKSEAYIDKLLAKELKHA